MAEKEIKITFAGEKLEALSFFLAEQGDTESGRAAERAGAGNCGRDSRKYDEHGNVRRISERI